AFRCLWQFARGRDDLAMLSDIADITMPYLDELNDEDKMDVDSKQGSKDDLTHKTARNGLDAIARGYARSDKTDFRAVVRDVSKHLQAYLSSPKFSLIKREVWYDCVNDVMADATKMTKPADSTPVPFDGQGILVWYLERLDLGQ